MNTSEHRVANINGTVFRSIVAAVLIAGCSSVEHNMDDPTVTEIPYTDSAVAVAETPAKKTPVNPSSMKTTGQRFTVQADTVTIQSRKKATVKTAPVPVKTVVVPQKYYSVQIGAFRLKSNAERNIRLLEKRFKAPVIHFYENGIKMERICIGRFSTLTEAKTFLRNMQKQYPAEYTQAWIAELKR